MNALKCEECEWRNADPMCNWKGQKLCDPCYSQYDAERLGIEEDDDEDEEDEDDEDEEDEEDEYMDEHMDCVVCKRTDIPRKDLHWNTTGSYTDTCEECYKK